MILSSLSLSLSLPPSPTGAEKVLLVSSTQTVVEVKQLSKSGTTTALPSICNMEIKVCTKIVSCVYAQLLQICNNKLPVHACIVEYRNAEIFVQK
jgi:hypothetical protein